MRLLVILLATCLTSGVTERAVRARQQLSNASGTRAAFLKLIDRPRVGLAPTVSLGSEADGFIAENISFASEPGQPVPTLLIKRKNASARRPAVIVLHGTGGSKEGMRSRLREFAASGFVAVAIDGRY